MAQRDASRWLQNDKAGTARESPIFNNKLESKVILVDELSDPVDASVMMSAWQKEAY